MKIVFPLLSWIFGCLFFLLFLLSLYSRHFLPALLVLLISVLLIPPVRHWISDFLRVPIPTWLSGVLIPVLFFLFVFLIFKDMGNKYSIYKNPDIEKRLIAIYETRIAQWPVPYESRYIDTQYGKVFVIVSGPEDAPPVFLLHASAMGSWSWLYNIKGLNKYYRTYAVDTIGDAGKSVLKDIDTFPNDGKALTELYTEIMDTLCVQKACFIGASQGGFITTNMALYAPDRVEKIILCGPMGYTGTNASVLRILFTTMFPVKPVQESATRWAFGDDPEIQNVVGEWFGLILQGVISRQARPQPFTREQLYSLKMPVLMLLGSRDGLVGNPENAKQFVKDMDDVRVEVLDTGHLISAERPDEFNKLVIDFIGQPER
ncbi:alpha/beta fold hydrolase [candidate division KSB1 bacterium]|nr:alpha/beta fold hydrolase [candidate division KSB1 bacterium]